MADSTLVWFHRILRWGLGLLFIGVGVYYWENDAWPAILFGAVMLTTGFFRPKCCIGEESCTMERR
jgi:hypothetical protein